MIQTLPCNQSIDEIITTSHHVIPQFKYGHLAKFDTDSSQLRKNVSTGRAHHFNYQFTLKYLTIQIFVFNLDILGNNSSIFTFPPFFPLPCPPYQPQPPHCRIPFTITYTHPPPDPQPPFWPTIPHCPWFRILFFSSKSLLPTQFTYQTAFVFPSSLNPPNYLAYPLHFELYLIEQVSQWVKYVPLHSLDFPFLITTN